MSDFTVSRPGQADGAGAVEALFKKNFLSEVMTTFDEVNVMMPLHMVRTIQNGNSAEFPATGVASASYHVPGTELQGQSVKHNKRTINIDSLLVADVFIANIDEAMNHFDVRSIYTSECGRALARKTDAQLLQVAVLAARATATVSGGDGGYRISDTDADTSAASLAGSIFAARQNFDEKFIPETDRVCIVRPAQYYLLVQTTDLINKDWGGQGSYAAGDIRMIGGMPLVKSTHIPSTNVSAETGVSGSNTYHADFSDTVAVVMQKGAVGTVKLLDLAYESEYSVRHQGTLIVCKYAMGHGILRPECAVEISKASF